MTTEKLLTTQIEYDNSIARAAEILNNSGVVAIPTETVYGLAASALDEVAINKVFAAKGRPQDNPLIVHVCDFEMLNEVACDVPKEALLCAEKFWPGPLTLVLPRTDKTAKCVSAGLDTVAVRMPSHKVALDIIKKSKLPLAAPSANISGSPSPTNAEHVYSDLNGKIDAIIYSGECDVGVESTVVSFTLTPPRLLRPGAVTVEQLSEIVPDIVVDSAVLSEPQKDQRVESPGMKYKHYAPKTEAFLVEATGDAFVEFVNAQKNASAICFAEEAEQIIIPNIVYGSAEAEETLAHEVFAALRKADDMNSEKVYIHAPTKQGVGLAVYNRLLRAAGFKVIKL